MYEQSIVPQHMPGGGGFSVMKQSLESMYEYHQLCTNWWTNSNENLPLCRYTGTTLYLYYSENIDYAFRYQTDYPMNSGKLTYCSLQPSIMMMMHDTILMPSKRTRPNNKKNIENIHTTTFSTTNKMVLSSRFLQTTFIHNIHNRMQF